MYCGGQPRETTSALKFEEKQENKKKFGSLISRPPVPRNAHLESSGPTASQGIDAGTAMEVLSTLSRRVHIARAPHSELPLAGVIPVHALGHAAQAPTTFPRALTGAPNTYGARRVRLLADRIYRLLSFESVVIILASR